MILVCNVLAADMDETWQLWRMDARSHEFEMLSKDCGTNARTEAADTRTHQTHKTRMPQSRTLPASILLTSAARRA